MECGFELGHVTSNSTTVNAEKIVFVLYGDEKKVSLLLYIYTNFSKAKKSLRVEKNRFVTRVIAFLDPENIPLDTKIVFLTAL